MEFPHAYVSIRGFALSRYFATASLVCIFVVAALLGWSYQYLAQRDLVHLGEDRNVALAHAISNSLWTDFSFLVETGSDLTAEELYSLADQNNLFFKLSSQLKNTEVVKVKVYSLDGITVFSSDPKQTGENKSENPAFKNALAGQLISGLTHKNTLDAFEGTLSDLDVISTYLPIYSSDKTKLTAIFEIYRDVTDLTTRLSETRTIVILAVMALLSLLYMLLYLIVIRAQHVINHQQWQLEDSIHALDTRVQERTEALDQSNKELKKEIVERTQTEDILRKSTARYKAVTQSARDAIITADNSGVIISWNKAAEQIFGYSEDEIKGRLLVEIVPEKYRKAHAKGFKKAIKHGGLRNYGTSIEVEALHKDNSIFPMEMTLATWEVAGVWHVSATIRDISEKVVAEHQLRIAAATFETQEGVTITDAYKKILRVNQAFVEITGYEAKDVVGLTPKILNSGRHDDAFYKAMWETIDKTGKWQGEIWNRRKNGELYPEWLTITAVTDSNGDISNYVGTFDDITQRKSAEQEISKLAFYDPLTELPNRRLLLDRLKHALASVSRTNRVGALLFIDLDNFKTLNDTLGHDVGDELLKQITQSLKSCMREGDTVSRLGGDEFVVILENLSEQTHEAATLAEITGEKLLNGINRTYQLGKFSHHCTASIGVTLFSKNGTNVDDLMKQADLAMYQAKDSGRNSLRFFDPKMQTILSQRAKLESDLRDALAKAEFQLFYQGQVDEQGLLIGVEALLRWNSPKRGLVSPLDFIPLAEESGLILPLGDWVLKTACDQLKQWSENSETKDLSIAVNISAKQLQQVDFVENVLQIISQSGASPHRLKLEITESLLVKNIEDAIEKMTALKTKGISFSLDDFGTGYSSLSYLKRLPLDQLKIDQSFVRNILEDTEDAAIASTVIALAKSLGLNVIAEGVETQPQQSFLSDQACEAYQGYLYFRPLPIEEFELKIREEAAGLVF